MSCHRCECAKPVSFRARSYILLSCLTKRPSIQLIAVGPVIDLYGRFAAEKLARLMEMHPDRVYSKPEFTALPPYLFSGADFVPFLLVMNFRPGGRRVWKASAPVLASTRWP